MGIAWPSPVTVDLLLCNMKLLYEAMSTDTSKMFEDLPEPFSCFVPFLHTFNSAKRCTDMGFYISNVRRVNGKRISRRIRFCRAERRPFGVTCC